MYANLYKTDNSFLTCHIFCSKRVVDIKPIREAVYNETLISFSVGTKLDRTRSTSAIPNLSLGLILISVYLSPSHLISL